MADITMPQLGETVTEGTITRWFKNVGDTIAADEVLFEVSTDKVDSEVPSPVAGVVSEILVPAGDTVDVGTLLARIGDAGSAPAAPPSPAAEPAPAPAPEPTPAAAEEPEPLPTPVPEPQPEPQRAPSEPAAPAAAAAPSSSNGGDTRLL